MTLDNSLFPPNLPRLAYISDVPIEGTYHGSMLLYRLLELYPKSKLLIVETGLRSSSSDKCIPQIKRYFIPPPFTRLQYTRYNRYYLRFLGSLSSIRARVIEKVIYEFKPESILSVVEGAGWIVGWNLAQKHRIPYHLIIHDIMTTKNFQRVFSKVCRKANSCLCISPYMAEIFQKEYRCKTDILLPSRSYLHHEYTTPSPTTLKNSFPLTIAFAGSIWHFYAEMIKLIANSLIKLGGEIHIYSDLTHKSYLEFGFNQHPNIFIKGYLPHPQIIDTLRNSAHALYSPLTFSPNDDNSRFCFPSKLADYTAVGLPIILHGPPYSSQIKWASQYSDAFIIIDDLNVENIRQSIVRLQNPEIRRSLAQKIIAIGKETFSWEKAWKTLCFHLTTP